VFQDVVRVTAAFGAREPLFRRLGCKGVSTLLIATGVFLWARDNRVVPGSECQRPTASPDAAGPEEIAAADRVFTFEKGRLAQIG
jgi:hypothetical protein